MYPKTGFPLAPLSSFLRVFEGVKVVEKLPSRLTSARFVLGHWEKQLSSRRAAEAGKTRGFRRSNLQTAELVWNPGLQYLLGGFIFFELKGLFLQDPSQISAQTATFAEVQNFGKKVRAALRAASPKEGPAGGMRLRALGYWVTHFGSLGSEIGQLADLLGTGNWHGTARRTRPEMGGCVGWLHVDLLVPLCWCV